MVKSSKRSKYFRSCGTSPVGKKGNYCDCHFINLTSKRRGAGGPKGPQAVKKEFVNKLFPK